MCSINRISLYAAKNETPHVFLPVGFATFQEKRNHQSSTEVSKMFHVHTQIYPQDKCTHTHYEYKNIYVYILMHIYINSHTITWCVYVVCMLVWRGGNEREQRFSEEGKKHVRNIPCFQDSSEMQVQFLQEKKKNTAFTPSHS